MSAAYGAVPWDAAPAQVARDGEDYAVAMLPEIAIEPFELYIDCAGTLSATRDPAIAQFPRHLRAHLWARVWASFRTLSSHKTKAHASKADVEQGFTTEWERKGNNWADHYAKLGASLHGVRPEHILEARAFASLAFQAARWAAEQFIIMAITPGSDSSELQSKQRTQSVKRQRPSATTAQAHGARPGNTDNTPLEHTGHRLRTACVEDGSWLIFCAAGGAYSWRRTGGLAMQCPACPRDAGAAARLKRMAKGIFPNLSRPMTMGTPRPPSRSQLAALAKRVCGRTQRLAPASWPARWDALGPPAQSAPTRAELLAAYGQDETSLAALVVLLAAIDAENAPRAH